MLLLSGKVSAATTEQINPSPRGKAKQAKGKNKLPSEIPFPSGLIPEVTTHNGVGLPTLKKALMTVLLVTFPTYVILIGGNLTLKLIIIYLNKRHLNRQNLESSGADKHSSVAG